jgi:hypothetical protein
MPAIQPARLRQQAVLLAEYYDQPVAFVRSLHHLLDFYADRTHRSGQVGEPPPLLVAYNVKPPVLRQVLQELSPLVSGQPEQALDLCDALWEQPYLEFRLLAAALLGQVSDQPADLILNRVQAWVKTSQEDRLIRAILTEGLAGLRRDEPDRLLQLIEEWLDSPEVYYQQLGLRTLATVAADPDFENLPVSFRLIVALVREAPQPLRPDLLYLLATLAHRTPRETAYYLRQSLDATHSPATAWLIRQSLREFPVEFQEGLRVVARE